MTNVAVLAPSQGVGDELDAAESRIEACARAAFYDIGMELKGIRDERLYKDRYQTFEQYCEQRWDWSRGRAYHLIAAHERVEEMSTIVGITPKRESHVRPLLDLDSVDDCVAAWNDALANASGPAGKVKAADVEQAVARLKAARERDWITLEEWGEMHVDVCNTVLSTPQIWGANPNSKPPTFNKQDNDSIEWARWSWNPVTGCKHDCPYCYARDIALRFYPQGFDPSLHPKRLGAPAATAVPAQAENDTAYRNVFTCSMADLFGRWVPAEWIDAVFDNVRDNPQWNFLFLTKFPKRMVEFDYPENAWLGTSVDCQARVKAAEDAFENVRSGTKWLSVEPMLEPLKFERLHLFDWIVIGGASKSNKTPAWIPPFDWIVRLHVQAREAGCAIYYKTNAFVDAVESGNHRLREFPWQKPAVPELPESLHYLGMKR